MQISAAVREKTRSLPSDSQEIAHKTRAFVKQMSGAQLLGCCALCVCKRAGGSIASIMSRNAVRAIHQKAIVHVKKPCLTEKGIAYAGHFIWQIRPRTVLGSNVIELSMQHSLGCWVRGVLKFARTCMCVCVRSGHFCFFFWLPNLGHSKQSCVGGTKNTAVVH